jgi:predicted metal-dependent hydrolase
MTWGSRHIPYTLIRESRLDLTITVYPDLRVGVRAPKSRTLSDVLTRVAKKRAWIARQLQRFEDLPVTAASSYESGETHLYLGRQYRMRVERTGKGVSLQGGRLVVRVPRNAGSRAVRNALVRWYTDRATNFLSERVALIAKKSFRLRNATYQLRVRLMQRRWGSCTHTGVITLNPLLIQAPVPCIDYVASHELVHLLEPTHSSRFYDLLGQIMPNWERRKRELDSLPIRYH